jgi:hypothetical protein
VIGGNIFTAIMPLFLENAAYQRLNFLTLRYLMKKHIYRRTNQTTNDRLLENTQEVHDIKYYCFIEHFENLLPITRALVDLITEELGEGN